MLNIRDSCHGSQTIPLFSAPKLMRSRLGEAAGHKGIDICGLGQGLNMVKQSAQLGTAEFHRYFFEAGGSKHINRILWGRKSKQSKQ